MKFELPNQKKPIIKVMGVGGGGSNAVNYMFNKGIKGVDFVVCNTDQQALDMSPVPIKVQLGATLTEGRGAGSIPEKGKNAAIENIDEIRNILEDNTKMVFITAGMGGGTGTGAAPIIAETARELGILTVGIVTKPFKFEGNKRISQADQGIEEMRNHVDTLLVINNDRLREMYGSLTMRAAFNQADEVLTTAARGIAEILTRTGYINVDFADVCTVMTNGGVAIMGTGVSKGENRAIDAVEQALNSPLLNDNEIRGAKHVLLNIVFGTEEILTEELDDITSYVQQEAGNGANIIWGYGIDESLEDNIAVTIIATGFEPKNNLENHAKPAVKVKTLTTEEPVLPKAPVAPVVMNTTPVEEIKVVQKEQTPTQNVIVFDLNETPEIPAPPVAAVPPVNVLPEAPITPVANTTPPATPAVTEEPVLKNQAPANPIAPEPNITPTNEPVLKQKPLTQVGFQPLSEPAPTEAPGFKLKQREELVTAKERSQTAQDRMGRLREISQILRTATGLNELEKEPAFVRKGISLPEIPHSSESQVSKFTLTEFEDENGNRKTEIRPNNSFLHDNVD